MEQNPPAPPSQPRRSQPASPSNGPGAGGWEGGRGSSDVVNHPSPSLPAHPASVENGLSPSACPSFKIPPAEPAPDQCPFGMSFWVKVTIPCLRPELQREGGWGPRQPPAWQEQGDCLPRGTPAPHPEGLAPSLPSGLWLFFLWVVMGPRKGNFLAFCDTDSLL